MTDRKPVEPTPADTAINRVLEAERAARDDIAASRRQALAILREARARARAVGDRADRRITRVRACTDRSISLGLTRIAAESAGLQGHPELTPALLERLDKAIDALLNEMVSEQP